MTEYPEHEKMRAISSDSQKLGEFLEWLGEAGFTLCETYNDPDSMRDGEYLPARTSTTELLARYFKIDLRKIENEKRVMLDEMRRMNGSRT